MPSRNLLLINGPNLNLLGTREPHIYGSTTLKDVESAAQQQASSLSISLTTFQSNHEGAIIDRIQVRFLLLHIACLPPQYCKRPWVDRNNKQSVILTCCRDFSGKQAAREEGVDAIIINPGGFTHTSVAIRDALLGVGIPYVELHVSNVHAREAWRRESYFTDKAVAMVCGMGVYGYTAAIEFAARHMKTAAAKEKL